MNLQQTKEKYLLFQNIETGIYPLRKNKALAILADPEYDLSFEIMCKEYGEDEDWVQVLPEDLETLQGEEYQTFEIWN